MAEHDVVPTPSQTAGPFFHIGFAHLCTDCVLEARAGDVPVTVRGRVVDGSGAPVPDAALEIRQSAEPSGTSGFARVHTDDDGAFMFTTIRPSVVAQAQSPHLAVTVFARGLLRQLNTRMYFPNE